MKFAICFLSSMLFLATVAYVLVKTEPAPVPPARMVRPNPSAQPAVTAFFK